MIKKLRMLNLLFTYTGMMFMVWFTLVWSAPDFSANTLPFIVFLLGAGITPFVFACREALSKDNEDDSQTTNNNKEIW